MQVLCCSKCKCQKPASQFYRDAGRVSGRHNQCKACQGETIARSKARARAKRAQGAQ